MAEIATIARPYAEALHRSGADDATVAGLEAAARVAADPQLKALAGNPKVTPQQVYDLIASVLPAPLPEKAASLVRTMVANGRVAALPEVAAQVRALANAGRGVSDAVIHSAFGLTPEQLAEVLPALERRFGRRLHATVVEDASLIGGIRVVVGDEVLDTSVKARLEQMKLALTA
jgi:F-type H+-transporting ATPase subunit delta